MPRSALSVLVASALLAAAPAHAQTVRGTFADGAGRGVAGAMVVLVDSAGTPRGSVLTDPAGRFTVSAPAPGTYRLHAERVGFERTVSPALPLAFGETRQYRLAAPPKAVALEGIVVGAAARRCTVRPDGGATATLWEEARKALDATAWAEARQVFRFEATRYRRELDPTLRLKAEERGSVVAVTRHPFASRPAAELATKGYVQAADDGATYHAPDAAVLLSPEFLEGHCFRVQDGRGETAGMIGLAFEPVRGRTLADVRGTLWVDRRSAELRWLEYRYVNLPVAVESRYLGGRVEFERLPGGAWIVRRWWVRMPVVDAEQGVRPSAAFGRNEVYRRDVLRGYREQGGEVVSARARDGSVLAERTLATLTGTVRDTTRGTPLGGARVFISGTAHSAVADAEGRFRIEGVPEGKYVLSFGHPRLDSLEVTAPTHQVDVGTDAVPPLALAVGTPRPLGRPGGSVAAAMETPGAALRLERVSVRARQSEFDAFRRRVSTGNGHYITREMIERERPARTVDLLRRVPGIEVLPGGIRLRGSEVSRVGGLATAGVAKKEQEAAEAATPAPRPLDFPMDGNPLEQQGGGSGARLVDCTPLIYVDGVPNAMPAGDVSRIPPGQVEGIEVYPRAAHAPAQFRRFHAHCGIILIWLRARD